MIRWYRQQIKQYGVIEASLLSSKIVFSLLTVKAINSVLSVKVTCPCCGWRGRRFLDYIELGYSVRNSVCPQCESHSRHRMFYLWLQNDFDIRGKVGTALVFAPERALAGIWEAQLNLKVHRLDIEGSRGTDLLADIVNLPFPENSIDFIWCHHVLEHVKDDLAGIGELKRVLKPGSGALVVSVPMIPGPTTQEYGFADPRLSGHWRIYGDDFADRLMAGGFSVEELDYSSRLDDASAFGIVPEKFYVCRKVA